MKKYDFLIRTKQDMLDAVNEFGFLPFFSNSIPGFSIEEHVSRDCWYFSDSGDWKVWEWKGPVINDGGFAYGKFLENKAVFISREWFLDFANHRRYGYDFDARYDEGFASRRDLDLYDLICKNEPVLSKNLKKLGNYRKDGNKGFETVITRLQSQCYVMISDFHYAADKSGKEYGWGIAEYSTPEKFFGPSFRENIYKRTPEESCERVLDHLRRLFPSTDEKLIKKILK
ncbi:MAG: hypothetical protein J6112_09505 [Clostridia bacterium]|nr:hypothetical protein [Clostridia bacterium]